METSSAVGMKERGRGNSTVISTFSGGGGERGEEAADGGKTNRAFDKQDTADDFSKVNSGREVEGTTISTNDVNDDANSGNGDQLSIGSTSNLLQVPSKGTTTRNKPQPAAKTQCSQPPPRAVAFEAEVGDDDDDEDDYDDKPDGAPGSKNQISKKIGATQLPGNPGIRLAKPLFIIYVVFTTCWMPYSLGVIIDRHDQFPHEVHAFITAFAHFNSSINWLVYYQTHHKMRRAFQRQLAKLFCFRRLWPSHRSGGRGISTVSKKSGL